MRSVRLVFRQSDAEFLLFFLKFPRLFPTFRLAKRSKEQKTPFFVINTEVYRVGSKN